MQPVAITVLKLGIQLYILYLHIEFSTSHSTPINSIYFNNFFYGPKQLELQDTWFLFLFNSMLKLTFLFLLSLCTLRIENKQIYTVSVLSYFFLHGRPSNSNEAHQFDQKNFMHLGLSDAFLCVYIPVHHSIVLGKLTCLRWRLKNNAAWVFSIRAFFRRRIDKRTRRI